MNTIQLQEDTVIKSIVWNEIRKASNPLEAVTKKKFNSSTDALDYIYNTLCNVEKGIMNWDDYVIVECKNTVTITKVL